MSPGSVHSLHAKCCTVGDDAHRHVCASLRASKIFELSSAKQAFLPASLGSSVGLLAVIKTQNPSCLQIHALDLPSPNPTSNMHLSPGQLAQITTALPEKGLFEPQGIGRRGWIIPSIQRPRGSFFFSECFQFPLGELLLGIFFPSVFPWMRLRLWSRKWGEKTSEKCIAPFQNSSGIN